MSSKQFCLKWNSFQTSIFNAFESLQNTEDLADVTLTCEGINLKAHKFILSACSPYFRTVFKENPCPHPIVILKDVYYTDLIALVNFMYHGEVMVSEDQLPTFLTTAKLLQVSGLNSTDSLNKKFSSNPKRTKAPTTHDGLNKKPKLKIPKENLNSSPIQNNDSDENLNKHLDSSPKQFPLIEFDQIKIEEGGEELPDVNENIRMSRKSDQGSILEAALDSKKSILERSLTAQNSGKSPLATPYLIDQINLNLEVTKGVFIPKKPGESELEKCLIKSPSSDTGSSISYDHRPSEILQQSLQVEGELYDSSDAPSDDLSIQTRSALDVQQAHHSSQCGNCPHCGKVYSNQSALKYHVRLVHSDLTNMYCCHLCPESFDFREGYKKHMAEVHSIRN